MTKFEEIERRLTEMRCQVSAAKNSSNPSNHLHHIKQPLARDLAQIAILLEVNELVPFYLREK